MADPVYLALLGSAEYFRTSIPPNYRAAIQCLQATLTIRLPPPVEAKVHLMLGRLYIQHTSNVDMASMHLDKAVRFNCLLTYFPIENHVLFSNDFSVIYHKCPMKSN